MADIQQVRGGMAGLAARDASGRSMIGNFHGTALAASRDVDDVQFQSALRSAITGQGRMARAGSRPVPQPRKNFTVPAFSLQEVARHARLSGDESDVHGRSLQFLRRRLLRQRPSAWSWQLASRSGDKRQYLALQKLQAALKARETARQQSASAQDAEDEFMAAMAPLSDNPGNATALARRFYDAMGRDADLQELLSGFEEKQRAAFMEELRNCPVMEEYDARHRATRKTFDKRQFCTALKRAMQLDHYQLPDEEADDLLAEVQDQLGQMEEDPDFFRFAQAGFNLAPVAEGLLQEGEDPAKFIENYSDLVHADASLASMCKRAAELFREADGNIDPEQLRMNMEAASRAANIDMDSTRPSHTDKNHLWAAVQSTKLIARLCTAVMLAQNAGSFLQRYFGRRVDASQLLQELLERMAQPNASPKAFLDMARKLNLGDEAMPATLKQASDFFRAMHDMFPDPQTRQQLLQNVLDAMDEAARLEDERLASQGESPGATPIAAPVQPKIPASPSAGMP